MHIGFLGFGLIAGAVAQAVRADPAMTGTTISAWSPSGDGPARAHRDGVIDLRVDDPIAAIANADLIVLAAPATACLALLDRLGGEWRTSVRPDAVVTDVASTKAALLARAEANGLRYVGGHPMAGLETAGYRPGTADLFSGRPWIVVPGRGASSEDVDRVVALARACGAEVTKMDALAHDRTVAAVSHLPLVLAAALVESVAGVSAPDAQDDSPVDPDWPIARALAAGGWRDATRVARGDPSMGAAIIATNPVEIARRIRALQTVLDDWLIEIDRPDGPDETAVRDRLELARELLENDL